MQATIEIETEDGDDGVFIAQVDSIVRRIANTHRPEDIYLVKIDNWFGHRWLRFSGEVHGQLGVWKADLTLPPFVPRRVVWERHFAAPDYQEVPSHQPLHVSIPSREGLKRRVSQILPNAVLIWFSGRSDVTGRGAVMSYIPASETHWTWYAGWSRNGTWRPCELVEISPRVLADLCSGQTSGCRPIEQGARRRKRPLS